MVKETTIISEEMPVIEHLQIRKFVVGSAVARPRICIVTGIHGDELEGQYVCYKIAHKLRTHQSKINGRVEIYPAINPLGVDSVCRGIPTFDLDMNRIFPGATDGHVVERIAHDVIEDLKDADLVIDIHSSNIFLYEMPQARISESTVEYLLPYAEMLNLNFIWIHQAATVLESTIAHSLNSIGTPTVVVEMGIGMRITPEYGNQLVDGIFNLLRNLGVWSGKRPENISTPIVSNNGTVSMINAGASGIVVNHAEHGTWVKSNQRLCEIVNPLNGKVMQEVLSPIDGLIFTMRGYPVVYEGSLIARIYSPN
ncbi:MAG: succinylglutamate desuccinylase/aspartoacylase family protein [Bacteroidales bacterium]|nr:succinylglutamate desuccinylase/aspartoacylase family protein [Bacteroidales bacterium]